MGLLSGFFKMTATAVAGGFGGWKLKEKYDAMKPNSITAKKLLEVWDSIVSLATEGDGEGQKMPQQLDEKKVRELERRLGELERDNRNTAALVQSLLQGHSYQHEFPPLPPPPPTRRP